MNLSRSEALQLLRRAASSGDTVGERWACPVGPLILVFPNFAWRRRAIVAHDLHHLMTGYPMTMRGEFQLAAWELAAGRYPHWGATLFCAPLVLLGFLWSPSRMIAALRTGRCSKTLYSDLLDLENDYGNDHPGHP